MSVFASGHDAILASLSNTINETGAREYLDSCNWPLGLQDLLMQSLATIPIRFFVYDDSGSMIYDDGHKLEVDSSNNKSLVECTRWAEVSDLMKFHIGLSRAASAVAEIRTLNNEEPMVVGSANDDLEKLSAFMRTKPNGLMGGGTPLCRHIGDIIEKVERIAPELEKRGHKACLVIVTDGEASDGDLMEAMKPLQDLPVWIVVRLCTDEENVVNYWNNLDRELELQMDVLDDFVGEAKEVYAYNKWITYGHALHRLREFGSSARDLDMLDEQELTADQMLSICSAIFGVPVDEIPHPYADWDGFAARVGQMNSEAMHTSWSVLSGTTQPWIDIAKVASALGK